MPVTFVGCANPDNDGGGPWCPTLLDFNGYFVVGSNNWVHCTHVCDVCVFPWSLPGQGVRTNIAITSFSSSF